MMPNVVCACLMWHLWMLSAVIGYPPVSYPVDKEIADCVGSSHVTHVCYCCYLAMDGGGD